MVKRHIYKVYFQMNGFYFLSLQVFEEGLLFNEMSFTHEEVVLGTQLKINVF